MGHKTWVVLSMIAASAPALAAEHWLQLDNLTLIDGTGAPPRAVDKLVARDGKIIAVDEDAPQPEPFDVVTRVDLGGAFVIPGLIDSHVHLSGYPGDREAIAGRMQQALRGGVTSVRDMAGDARVLADARRAVLRGELTGLTIAPAALMGGPTMFADPRVGLASVGYAAGTAPWAQAITAESDLALAVARAVGAGAHAIKVYGNLDGRLVASIAAEAHNQGLAVWAHATVFPAAPGELLDAGVDVLSHAPYLVWEAVDEVPADYGARRAGPYDDIDPEHPKIEALLRRMAVAGTPLDTTLLIYRDAIRMAEGSERGAWSEKAFDWGVRVTRLAHRLGVPLAAGTDRFLKDEWSLPDLHDELAILVDDAGLEPMDALVAATATAARASGLGAERGTLAIGKAADLVVLGANPLADIAATRAIRLVVKDGVIVHEAQGPAPAPP